MFGLSDEQNAREKNWKVETLKFISIKFYFFEVETVHQSSIFRKRMSQSKNHSLWNKDIDEFNF